MATSTVKSTLHFSSLRSSSALLQAGLCTKLALAASLLLSTILFPTAEANANAADLDVLRVDVPLDRSSFRNGELKISTLIADNTYIDVEEFNLRAIELEASSSRNGEVRLKVGRYVTPPVPLPGSNNEGLLRIEAPHKSNKSWRLLIEDRIHITSLTAVLEPRDDNAAYYESRYESRGYTLGRDANYRAFSRSRHDSWPYSWLGNNYDYNRRSAHWFWLNDSRSRFGYNPGYGHGHRHTTRCYDRFGRHMRFNSSINNRSRFRDSRDYYRSRDRSREELHHRQHLRTPGPQRSERAGRSERQERDAQRPRPERNPTREPVMRAPNTPRSTTTNRDGVRNQAAQVQMQQRMQQQAQARRQLQLQAQQRQLRDERRAAKDRQRANSSTNRSTQRPERATRSRSERAQRYNRPELRRPSKNQRQ